MGLVDFWCYENEEMMFEDGHMLLRGSNGSGKSVTLQSFIPLLLDGNKNSERLDTFGSRSRKMDTYLIDENSDREERIGYLYLEFKRADSELYLTIGMGLRARKNKKLDSWYFVIEDNRRINRDFSLMENHLTLSEKQLKNILGDQVIDNQNAYMRKVNDALFGFENLDDYRDAINLLLQLRMPKLSNSLNPSKINEILEKSLLPLSEEDLRPMSEAIMNMDILQDELASLKQSLSAAKSVNQAYDTYNVAMLVDKWKKYSQQQQQTSQLIQESQAKQKENEAFEDEIKQLTSMMSKNRIDHDIKVKEKSTLMTQDLEKLHEESMSLAKETADYIRQISKKSEAADQKENRIMDTKKNLQVHQDDYDSHEKQARQSMNELDLIYENYPLSEHAALKETVNKKEAFSFAHTKKYLKDQLQKINAAISEWQKYEALTERLAFFEGQKDQCLEEMKTREKSIEDAKNTYKEIINEYNEAFYRYNEENTVLKLADKDLRKMAELLAEYEETKDYFAIQKIVQDQYFRCYKDLNEKRLWLENKIEQTQNMYDETNREWQSWMERQEIEPQRDEETILNRQLLKAKEIDFIPFFELLDFEDNVSQQDKNRVEELLDRMHILDAIVVEKKYQSDLLSQKPQYHDYYLWTDRAAADLPLVKLNNLTSKNDLMQIFAHLGIDDQQAFTLNDYYFTSGIIQGTVSGKQESLYIGYETRRKKRQAKLDELSQLMASMREKIEELNGQMADGDHLLALLENEYASFNDEQDLKQALNLVEEEKGKYQQLIFQKMNIESEISKLINESEQLLLQLKVLASQWLLKAEKQAFENRKQDIEDYSNELDNFKEHYQACLRLYDQLVSENRRLEELTDDLDTLKYELDDLTRKKEICQGKQQVIDSQLDEMGYADIKQRMADLEITIEQLNKDYQEARDRRSYCLAMQEALTKEMSEWQTQIARQEEEEKVYLKILEQELAYGLVLDKALSVKDAVKPLRKLALENPLKRTITEYQTAFLKVLYDQSAYLTQYRPMSETDALIDSREDVSEHLLLKAYRQGKKMPFGDLTGILEESIETQQLLINDKDREIFEDILVNTIGKKIRYRIHASRRWVDKMERYIQTMSISSGLQLSLRWRSRKADNDGQLDTSELVTLLDKDYHVLKDTDREKISRHFRSKIEYARKTSLDEHTTASFHQLIKEVMDYRQWFEFTLYAKKPNEQRKELTNHIFGAYSGGEKAIVMYVPLFSAVAAKMESAREDAPLLIALDEAFAGVDENNIDNLFALIEKFGFDYIMNSQVLWGDYPSCKSLAIYELFRLNNDPFITTVAYTWNGHVKQVKI